MSLCKHIRKNFTSSFYTGLSKLQYSQPTINSLVTYIYVTHIYYAMPEGTDLPVTLTFQPQITHLLSTQRRSTMSEWTLVALRV